MSKQLNVRLPEKTSSQLEKLQEDTGMTQVQIIIVALDRMYQEERVKEMSGYVIGVEFETTSTRKAAMPFLQSLFENVTRRQTKNQGIHVICSKPIGKTYDEAFEICKKRYFECGWLNVDSL